MSEALTIPYFDIETNILSQFVCNAKNVFTYNASSISNANIGTFEVALVYQVTGYNGNYVMYPSILVVVPNASYRLFAGKPTTPSAATFSFSIYTGSNTIDIDFNGSSGNISASVAIIHYVYEMPL